MTSYLEREALWDRAIEFIDWDYRLDDGYAPGPSYPESFVDQGHARWRIDKDRWGFPTPSYAEANRHRLARVKCTNCCQFTEAVIIGAAMRLRGFSKWPLEWHNHAMVAPTFGVSPPPFSPLVAYAAAGLAVRADEDERPGPGEWCICQGFTKTGGGHSFFVIDATEDGRCLTLEANCFIRYPDRGFVGHRGKRAPAPGQEQPKTRSPSSPIRLELPRLDEFQDLPTWDSLKRVYGSGLRFARLNLVKSSISLPFGGELNPQRQFYLSEARGTRGGYFPLGKYRNVHTGIHMVPDEAPNPSPAKTSSSEKTPAASGASQSPSRLVYALAPGEIVALRLPNYTGPASSTQPSNGASGGEDSGEDPNELSRMLTGSDNGFVLLRHRVIKKPSRDEKPDPADAQAFYSLYLHLRAPRLAPEVGKRIENEIPWLKRMFQRYGSVTVVAPANHPQLRARRWLTKSNPKSGEIEATQGKKLEVFTDDFSGVETLDLSDASIVLRPPEKELDELLTRLEGNQVVTFREPFLTVGKGEAIGMIAAESKVGKGFVHWEILTPGEDSMRKLLDHLNSLLPEGERLPADFFVEVKESSENNLFDGDEVANIVAKLPDSDAEQREKLAGYNSGLLTRSFGIKDGTVQSCQQLAFDTHPDTPKGFFATKLRVSNGKGDFSNLVPGETYSLEITALGGEFEHTLKVDYKAEKAPVEIPVILPAGTTQLQITTDKKLFIDPANAATAGVGERLAFLQRLGKARLRNSVVQHLNEWTAEGLETTLKARLAKEQWIPEEWRAARPALADKPDDEALKSFVAAVSWWGVNGPAGAEHELFGDKEGQLAPTAKTESVHPITFTWLLQILESAGLIEFLTPAPWQPADAKKAGFLAWQGARKRKVGELVDCIAVQKSEPGLGQVSVRLLAKPEGKASREVGKGSFEKGTFVQPLLQQLWGKLELQAAENPEAQDQDAQRDPRPLFEGAADVEVIAPKHLGLSTPVRVGNEFVARLDFEKGLPESLNAWIVLRKEDASEADYLEPCDDLFLTAKPLLPFRPLKGLEVEDGLLKGLPPTGKLTDDFDVSAYHRAAAPKKACPSVRLVDAVQRLRSTSGGREFLLSVLSENGLKISFELRRSRRLPESLEKLWEFFDGWLPQAQKCVDALGIKLSHTAVSSEERKKRAPVVEVEDRCDAEAGGTLEIRFDATKAAFAASSLAPNNRGFVEARVGVRYFNGADPAKANGKTWDEKKEGALDDRTCWAPEPILLAGMPRVVSAELEMVPRQPTARLLVIVAGGDEEYWKRAAPKVHLNDSPSQALHARMAGGVRTLAFAFPADKRREKLRFKLERAAAKFLGKELGAGTDELKLKQIGGEDSEYDNSSRQGRWLDPEDGKRTVPTADQIEVTLQTKGVLGDDWIEIVQVDSHNEIKALQHGVTYPEYAKVVDGGKKRTVGRCMPDGVFRASLSFQQFALSKPASAEDAAAPQTLEFKVIVRDSKGKSTDFPELRLTITLEAPDLPQEAVLEAPLVLDEGADVLV